MQDHQDFPADSLRLPDPVVVLFNDPSDAAWGRDGVDRVAIGDALLTQTEAIRINYDSLGPTDAPLHALIFPRYGWEKQRLRMGRSGSILAPSDPSAPSTPTGMTPSAALWASTFATPPWGANGRARTIPRRGADAFTFCIEPKMATR